jgi:iron complex outermembrane receptor protein
MRRLISASIGGLLTCTAWIGTAQAAAPVAAASAGELEEVIVTAERREENLQKTPMNVTVVTGEKIAEQGLQNMQDILNGLPGVTVQSQVRGFVPSVRGLGTDLPPGSAQGSVATTEDGVYDIRAEAGRTGYYDLARVEVLSGPQGTLYGVNADGGVVNIITNNPVLGKLEASGGLTVGNFNLVRGEGMVNVPVSDSSALRIAVTSTSRDGYLNTGADDNVASGARIKYQWTKSDSFSMLLGVEIAKLGGIGSGSVPTYASGNASPVTVNGVTYSSPWTDATTGTAVEDSNAWDRYHSTKYWASLNWNLGIGTLSFTPAYKANYDKTYTCGMGPTCSLGGDPAKLEQNSAELRLASAADSKTKWDVGAYHWGYLQNSVGGPGGPNGQTVYQTSNGVFGALTYSFSDALRGLLGARETQDWKKDSNGNGPATWTHFDYRAGLEWDASAQSMEYVTLASGYRPGGFNFPGPNNPAQYKTEEVTDVEFGTKNRFMDNRLQLNADVYFYKFKNYQLLDFYFPNCNFGGPPAFPPTYNLDAKNLGLDLSLQAKLTSNDTLSASLSLTDTKFTSKQIINGNGPNACSPPNFTPDLFTYQIDNSPQPRSAKYSGSLSYEHSFPLASGASIAVQPSAHFSDHYFVHPIETIYSFQPSFVTGDFSVLYKKADDNLSISAWVRNVSNKAIKGSYFPMIIGAPRTFGLTITAKFN